MEENNRINPEKGDSVSPLNRTDIEAQLALDEAKRKKKSRETISITVESVTSDGTLSCTDENGVTYAVRTESISAAYPGYTLKHAGYLLGHTIKGHVGAINQPNRLITLTDISRDSLLSAGIPVTPREAGTAQSLKTLLNAAIGKKGKDRIVVSGTVTEAEKEVAFVDIYKTGVIGAVPAMNYRSIDTPDLTRFLKPGDTITGMVTDYRSPVRGKMPCYVISTAEFQTCGLDSYMNAIKKDDTLVVTCTDIPGRDNQTYFRASSPLLPGIDIMCDYTNRVPKEAVYRDATYLVRIRRVEIEQTETAERLLVFAAAFRTMKLSLETKQEGGIMQTPEYVRNAVVNYKKRHLRCQLSLSEELIARLNSARLKEDGKMMPLSEFISQLIMEDLEDANHIVSFDPSFARRSKGSRQVEVLLKPEIREDIIKAYFPDGPAEDTDDFPMTHYLRELLAKKLS